MQALSTSSGEKYTRPLVGPVLQNRSPGMNPSPASPADQAPGESPRVSLVIPAWNEAQRLPAALKSLRHSMAKLGVPFEVLLVVEPGTDSTLHIANSFAADAPGFFVVSNSQHLGKGHAIRTGVLRAKGEFIFYMDADLSVPLEEVASFLRVFAECDAVDVLVGNRAHADSRIFRRQPFVRRKMGQVYNKILHLLRLASLHDTQCGFKAFRRHAALDIFRHQSLDGFAFDVEVLLLAEGLGYRIADLPVEWRNSPESKVHIVRDSLRMFWDTLWVRRRVQRVLAEAEQARGTTDCADQKAVAPQEPGC